TTDPATSYARRLPVWPACVWAALRRTERAEASASVNQALKCQVSSATTTSRQLDQRYDERDAKHASVPLRRVRTGELRWEKFLYDLKAGPAGGLRPPSGPAATRRSPGSRLILRTRGG